MSFFDYEFSPWRVEGDKRIVAAEEEWAKVLEWSHRRFCLTCGWVRNAVDSDGEYCPACNLNIDDKPCVVHVPIDFAEEWGEYLCFEDGSAVRIFTPRGTEGGIEFFDEYKHAQIGDIRAELFRLIDETPNLRWMLWTETPGRVKAVVYDHWTYKVPGHITQNEGDGRRWKKRPNVYLGTTIRTQAEADQRIPELLKLRDLVPVLYVIVEPEEAMHIHPLIVKDEFGNCGNQVVGDFEAPAIDWIIIRAAPNKATNIEHIRSIVQQCQAAGVKCWVESLNWITERENILLAEDFSEWPEDLRVREVPECS